ncbi:VWA domain-containing protein [Acidicapsa dinghuensis]|uniref:VWA domain-containing protein n=1 Tax=Acidicapsa dinghuensis TaxID=2218256 RepID=A0ABW1ELG1_9BACT|nr:VWA domain-containing protein [Acidicapsa dinghuensis]
MSRLLIFPGSFKHLHLLVSLPLCFCSLAIAQAQTPQQSSGEYHFQSDSNLVVVPVVVRDKQGRPVTGLTRNDFKLSDQGKQQTISQFEEEASPATSTPSSAQTTAPSTVASMAATPHPRFVAIYFDDLNTPAADLIHARDALSSLIASGIPPEERIAIFNSKEMLSSFTADTAQLHTALLRLQSNSLASSRARGCPDLSDFEAFQLLETNDLDSDAWRTALTEYAVCSHISQSVTQGGRVTAPSPEALLLIRGLAQQISERSKMLALGNLEQLAGIVSYISQAPGTRSIVFVSPGFLSQSEQLKLDHVIETSLRSQIVINSLNPKGLFSMVRETDASDSSTALADTRAAQARHTLDAQKEFAGDDVMAELAQGTGGQFFHNDNDLQSGLSAFTTPPPRYILAFSPKDVKDKGSFHTIKVAFADKKKGYTIQARSGYYTATIAHSKPTRAEVLATSGSLSVPAQPATGTSAAATPAATGSSATATPTTSTISANLSVAPPLGSSSTPTTPTNSARKPQKPRHSLGGKNKMTIGQLQLLLASSQSRSDSALARRLTSLELTERLDDATFARLNAMISGNESKGALRILSDESVFQPLPAGDLPQEPPPSEAAQQQWIAAVSHYVSVTLAELPNFFATRKVSSFADSPPSQDNGTFYNYQPVHAVGESSSTVFFRSDREVVDASIGAKTRELSAATGGSLNTSGEFGPLLGIVLKDALNSTLTWDHWETEQSGSIAVFHYSVPREKSHYEVQFCCVDLGMGSEIYRQISEYGGEISIDPATGSVLRLTIQPRLKPSHPLERADMLIDYGSVTIGGTRYICPLRSVTIAVAVVPAAYLDSQADAPEVLSGRASTHAESDHTAMPDSIIKTFMNETNFVDYHVFRSDSRLVPASVAEPK